MTDSGSALESLLLLQSVANHGATVDSFARIAESFKTSDLLQESTSLNEDRFDARSLTDTYLRLLKTEAKTSIQNAYLDSVEKVESPQLSTIEDAAAHFHLIPQLIAKLFDEYKDRIVDEIREDERTFDKLVKEDVKSDGNRPNGDAISSPEVQPTLARPSSNDETKIDAILNDTTPDETTYTPHVSEDTVTRRQLSVSALRSTPQPQIPSSVSPSAAQSPHSGVPSEPLLAAPATDLDGTRVTSPTTTASITQQPPVDTGNPPSSGGPADPQFVSSLSIPSTLHSRQPSQEQSSRLSEQSLEQPHTSLPPPHYPRWMQSPYTSPYRSQAVPVIPSHQQYGPSVSTYGPTRQSGGVQLPPFSIKSQAPLAAQTSLQGQTPARQSGSQPTLTLKTAQDQTRVPKSLSSNLPATTATGNASSPSIGSLIYQSSDVHFSPGSSTGWKGIGTGEKSRPRSVSPLTDTEGSTKRSSAKGTSRRTKPSTLSLPQGAQTSVLRRRPSKTPSVAGVSNQNRTRSQSVASFADDTSMASFPTTVKGLKADVSTPTPGERSSLRRNRSHVTIQSAAPLKRKRETSFVETPAATSGPASPSSTILPQPPMQAQTTVNASRNFNKMTAPLMDHIASHKHASLFANPVTARTKGYYDIIRRPTDLKTIRSQIAAGNRAVVAATASSVGSVASPGAGGSSSHAESATTITLPYSDDLSPPKAIVNAAQLEQELMRMFANAVMFNEGDDGVVADTREMFEEVEKSIAAWRGAESGWEDASGFDDTGGSSKRRRA